LGTLQSTQGCFDFEVVVRLHAAMAMQQRLLAKAAEANGVRSCHMAGSQRATHLNHL